MAASGLPCAASADVPGAVTTQPGEIVFNAGYASPVRTPRGRDILAACGQLKTDSERRAARAARERPEERPADVQAAG